MDILFENTEETNKEKKTTRKRNKKTEMSYGINECSEIMAIVKWIESDDENEIIPSCVLAHLSFDNIPVSYDILDFRHRNNKIGPKDVQISEKQSERQSGGGNLHKGQNEGSGGGGGESEGQNVDQSNGAAHEVPNAHQSRNLNEGQNEGSGGGGGGGESEGQNVDQSNGAAHVVPNAHQSRNLLEGQNEGSGGGGGGGDAEGQNVDQSNGAAHVVSNAHKSGGESARETDGQESLSKNVLVYRNNELSPLEALEILTNVDASKIAEHLDFKPKGGSVYLYALKQRKKTDEDWKCDGYSFWQNGSKKCQNKK